MRRHFSVLALGLLLSACGGGGSDSQPSPLEAKWSQTQQVIGSSLVMSLHVQDGKVSGGGAYTVEAGMPGTLTVLGSASGNDINVTLTFSTGQQAQFSGSLTDSAHLDGRMSYDNSPAVTVSFIKS